MRYAWFGSSICAALLFSGCASTPSSGPTITALAAPAAPMPCADAVPGTTSLRQIRVVAHPGANLNNPIPLDLVFIYAPGLREQLPNDASGWFAQRDTLRLAHSTGMAVVSLAVVPGAGAMHIELPEETRRVHRVLAYPLYQNPAARGALELTRFERVKLTLNEQTVTMCRE